ncbi:hypothetical protein [Candidatus Nanohalococcus occultus]|uniref:hypothetical protein n=1 Tax=Candidatus Nanohalococcus occultus TaxID=2978047 RepID=UPI0039E0F274
MELKKMATEWRIWVLVLSLLAALAMLGPHYEQQENGEYTIATGINKGLELQGGTRILLDVNGTNVSEENITEIRNILGTRVSAFGLTQTDIRTVRLGDERRIQIEVADTNQSRLTQLLSQKGSFQARLQLDVTGERQFDIENSYTLEKTSDGLRANGTEYMPGDRFKLDSVEFVYLNDSQETANLEVVMYTGEDVKNVQESEEGITQGTTRRFPIIITTEAADRIETITQNYGTRRSANGQSYLSLGGGSFAQLRLYVDDSREASLQVSSTFQSGAGTTQSIQVGGETPEEARAEAERIASILQSGALPYPVTIESISTITSSLGSEFMTAAFLSIVASLIAVGVLVFFRYGDFKVALPIVVTGSSEVFILLGAWFSTAATLDLASIAGIIAAVGTGVDDQIIITDESGRERVRSWKKRMKRAFFVIFTSAASTIGAMMPIVTPELSTMAVGAAGLGLIGYTLNGKKNPHYLAVGALALTVSAVSWTMSPSGFALQAVRGFAVTTILGIMVGIAITRPAYAKILENIQD